MVTETGRALAAGHARRPGGRQRADEAHGWLRMLRIVPAPPPFRAHTRGGRAARLTWGARAVHWRTRPLQDPNSKPNYKREVDRQLTKIQSQVTELRDLLKTLTQEDNLAGAALLEVGRASREPRSARWRETRGSRTRSCDARPCCACASGARGCVQKLTAQDSELYSGRARRNARG